jgi:hypothetical protein
MRRFYYMHATVKEALALSQVGPSAEMPPPDPTGAEPGRESADFQMRRRRRCLCDIGTKSRGLSEWDGGARSAERAGGKGARPRTGATGGDEQEEEAQERRPEERRSKAVRRARQTQGQHWRKPLEKLGCSCPS